ncbi:MAG TPA: hypothetical protein VFH47_00215 [Candidatus Thermoplasmatota archaeon]|nr:hypothetical protein [Candidatus Thermoplasmatota archaeon]
MDPIRYVRLELLDVLQRANDRLRELGPEASEQERLRWQRIAERALRYDLQLELDPDPRGEGADIEDFLEDARRQLQPARQEFIRE